MSLLAPPVNECQRIPEGIIRDLVSQIIQTFQPLRIILFGSYDSGNPRPGSDVDLLVMMETSLPNIQQALKIRQYIKPMFGVDILYIRPSNWNAASGLEIHSFRKL